MDLHRLNDVIYDHHASRSGAYGSEHALAYSASRQGALPQPGSIGRSHPLSHVDELRVDNMSLNKNRNASMRSKFPELHSPVNEREHHLSALSRAKTLLQYDNNSPSVAGGAAEEALHRSLGDTYASTGRSEGDNLLGTTVGRSHGSTLGESWRSSRHGFSGHDYPPSPNMAPAHLGDTYRSTASHRPGRSAVVSALLDRMAEVDAMSPPGAVDSPPLPESPQQLDRHHHPTQGHTMADLPWDHSARVVSAPPRFAAPEAEHAGRHSAVPHFAAPEAEHAGRHSAATGEAHSRTAGAPHMGPAGGAEHARSPPFPRHFPRHVAEAAAAATPGSDSDSSSDSDGSAAGPSSAEPSPFQQAPYWAQRQPEQRTARAAAPPTARQPAVQPPTPQGGTHHSPPQGSPRASPRGSPLQDALEQRRQAALEGDGAMDEGRAQAALQWARSFAPRPLTPPSRASSPSQDASDDGVARAVAARLRARDALGSPAVAAPSRAPATSRAERPRVAPVQPPQATHTDAPQRDDAPPLAMVPSVSSEAHEALSRRGEAHEAILAEHHVMLRELATAQKATQETLAAMQASQMVAIQTQAELLATLRAAGFAGLSAAAGGAQGAPSAPSTAAATTAATVTSSGLTYASAAVHRSTVAAADPARALAAAPVWPAASSHPDKAPQRPPTRHTATTAQPVQQAQQPRRVHGVSPLAVSDAEGSAPAPLPPPDAAAAPPGVRSPSENSAAVSKPRQGAAAAAGSGASGMTEPAPTAAQRQSGTGGSDSGGAGAQPAPKHAPQTAVDAPTGSVHFHPQQSRRAPTDASRFPVAPPSHPPQHGAPSHSPTDAGTGSATTPKEQTFNGGPRPDALHPSWDEERLVTAAEVQLTEAQLHEMTVQDLLHKMQRDVNPGAQQLRMAGRPLLWPGVTLGAAGLPSGRRFFLHLALDPRHPFVQEQARQAAQAEQARQAAQAEQARQAAQAEQARQAAHTEAADSKRPEAAAAPVAARQGTGTMQPLSTTPSSGAAAPPMLIATQPSAVGEHSTNPMQKAETRETTPAAAAAAAVPGPGNTPSRVLRGAGASFGSDESDSSDDGHGQLQLGPDGETYPLEKAPKAFRHPSTDEWAGEPPPAAHEEAFPVSQRPAAGAGSQDSQLPLDVPPSPQHAPPPSHSSIKQRFL